MSTQLRIACSCNRSNDVIARREVTLREGERRTLRLARFDRRGAASGKNGVRALSAGHPRPGRWRQHRCGSKPQRGAGRGTHVDVDPRRRGHLGSCDRRDHRRPRIVLAPLRATSTPGLWGRNDADSRDMRSPRARPTDEAAGGAAAGAGAVRDAGLRGPADRADDRGGQRAAGGAARHRHRSASWAPGCSPKAGPPRSRWSGQGQAVPVAPGLDPRRGRDGAAGGHASKAGSTARRRRASPTRHRCSSRSTER